MSRESYFRRFVPENVDGHVALKVATDNEILRVTSGSELYGTSLGTGDHDEMGVFIEPPEYVLAFKQCDVATYRTQPDGVKSGPGDIDLSIYSLRKFLSLAMQGNPTILTTLFAPESATLYKNEFGSELLGMADAIVSQRAFPRFRGYMEAQKKRLMGEKRGHVPSRPELIEQFGYDTKYAMHVLRLGMQGCELMYHGSLELPVSPSTRNYLLQVRQGAFSYEEILRDIEEVEEELEWAGANNDLREEPDTERLTEWIIDVHLRHWNKDAAEV